MASQPAYRPLEPSSLFPDGRSARPLVPGTVARGYLRTDTHRFAGKRKQVEEKAGGAKDKAEAGGKPIGVTGTPAVDASYVDTFPYPITRGILERGRQRYEIFCVVCHDPLGNGRGKIVERGYTPPPSYHIQRLREAPVGHFFDVITNGYGSMPDYAAQVPPDDRWAIAAYIRVLQQSQHERPENLPEEDRRHVPAGGQR